MRSKTVAENFGTDVFLVKRPPCPAISSTDHITFLQFDLECLFDLLLNDRLFGIQLGLFIEHGGKPEQICRMTAYCTENDDYLAHRLELGSIWKKLMGKHYPALSMIFVSDLLDHPGKIELEATAVIP